MGSCDEIPALYAKLTDIFERLRNVLHGRILPQVLSKLYRRLPALQIERYRIPQARPSGAAATTRILPASPRDPAAPFNHYIPVSRERADVLWGIWRPDRLLLLAMYNPASFYITL